MTFDYMIYGFLWGFGASIVLSLVGISIYKLLKLVEKG